MDCPLSWRLAMSDPKYPIPHRAPQLPAARAAPFPDLPYSSGQLALTRRSRAVKDAAYTRALADLLVARTEQAKAARGLSDARFDLAVALSKWDSLSDVCDFERKKGFLTRTSELTTLALELETKELNARIARDQAMLVLQSFQPPPPPLPPITPPPAPTGLTPADVRMGLQAMPEFRDKPDLIEMMVLMFGGMMAEKNR
jgi:hypothetical protein